ncbi:hypothetical protein FQA39_LY01706 [Lamprigera yunnana]|nr:hypothetical protein FQA39_LY01706 [Lamprigera yunnana]
MDITESEKFENKICMFFEKARLETFKTWIYDEHSNCNPKKLAEAGFYYNGTAEEPDAVQCFYCDKALDGWDKDDDPWMEHINHSKTCNFAVAKQPENNLTFNQLIDFYSAFMYKNMKQVLDTSLTKYNAERSAKVTKLKKSVNLLKNIKLLKLY